MKIREGENIKVVEDGEDVFIHAPLTNKTTLKHGVFTLQGDAIEILAGEGIQIKTAHPNKMTFSVNMDKEKSRIVTLEKRVENLEKVIADLLKPEPMVRIGG
jgi:predicted RNA-binding protein with EMAP domain